MNPVRKLVRLQSGLTLIELMISLVLGLITIAAALTIYIVVFKGSVLTIRATKLNYDVDTLMLLMANDIRRSGYWAGSISGTDPVNNPFSVSSASISITSDYDTGSVGNQSCITYSYDANYNSIVETNELYGFRLNPDNSVSMRVSAASISVADDCTDASGTWSPVTVSDGIEKIRVTSLSFTNTGSECEDVTGNQSFSDTFCNDALSLASVASSSRLVGRRVVNINIEAQSEDDQNILKSSSLSVVVANDEVLEK